MDVLSTILQILLGVGFLLFGFMKFGSKQMVNDFKKYGYTKIFRILTGLVEVIAAILLIAGIWNEQLAAIGALLATVVMIGAILTHIRINDPIKNMMMPIILLVLSVAVLFLNYSSILG